ncbi:MAG: hypothetical protein JOZ41_00355 [Chloroflexi bacterium]|nr:hypothetical protein [Chloroflexota bacterium]
MRWLKALGRAPSVTLARLTLESYARSGWLLGEVLMVLGMLAAFLFPFTSSVAAFYSIAGQGLAAVSVVGTVIMTRLAVGARVYPILARLPSPGTYSRGLMLATAALRIPLFLLLLLLALGLHRIEQAHAPALLVGSIGLLANCILLSGLTVALATPIGTRAARTVLVLWLLAASVPPMDVRALGLPTLARVPLEWLTAAAHVPLLPLLACADASTRGSLAWPDIWALTLVGLYLIGIAQVAAHAFERRDLTLH